METNLKACHDCGVDPGQAHEDGCDTARCLVTGGQRLMCDSASAEASYLIDYTKLSDELQRVSSPAMSDELWSIVARLIALTEELRGDQGLTIHDCGKDVWTGEWPGDAEAREFGWYSKFIPGEGWVQTTVDDPDASPDLNRLIAEAKWDPDQRRWVQ